MEPLLEEVNSEQSTYRMVNKELNFEIADGAILTVMER